MRIIPLFVIICLGASFFTAMFGRKLKWLPDLLCSGATLFLLGLSVFSAFLVNANGVMVYKVGGWAPPVGISMVLDGLSSFMLITVNLIAFLVAVYSVDYMEKFTSKWKFYSLFLLMLGGMNGVIITGDMFNLYVFLEIASIASYALVAFGVESEELEASFKYAVMGIVASTFILLGIVFLYSHTSTLNMADMAIALSQAGGGRLISFVSVLFIMGFGLKAALVPFHAWLPDAHPSAPAPISAMLSGVLIKALGVYALARIFYNVIGVNQAIFSTLMFLGALSMVVGVFLAIGQWDLKRLLAYHSISQIGYVVLGLGLGTPLGILGGLFHLFNHSIFKSLLFLNSGAIVYSAETRNLKEMGGLNEKMPVTGSTSLIASMSISGIPPFNGFWSKLIIILACVQANHNWYAFWACLASIITLASFTKVQRYAFFGALKEKMAHIKAAPASMQFSMIALAVICAVSGLLILPKIAPYFLQSAKDVLLSGKYYALAVLESVK